MRIIVLPDSHSKPHWIEKQNNDGFCEASLLPLHIANRRYVWLACFVLDQIKLYPDEEIVFLDLGDFADMPSLCPYIKGKRSAEMQRVKLDLKYSQDARDRLSAPLKSKKIKKIALIGNHEMWWAKFTEENPQFHCYDGINVDVSEAEHWGWEVIPFLEAYEIEGVYFSHYFVSGDMGKPIGGVNSGRSHSQKLHKSTVSGHSHKFSFHNEKTAMGSTVNLVAGCYYEHTDNFRGLQGSAMQWRGITVLKNVKAGSFEVEQYSMDELKRQYWNESQGPYNWAELGVV